MNTSVWVSSIVIILFTTVPILYSGYTQKQANLLEPLKTSIAEYRVHWLIKLMLFAEVCMSLWIFITFRRPGIEGILFIGGISLVLLSLGITGLIFCWKAKVRFEGDCLCYYDGLRNTIVDLKKVKNVWAANGYIVIDLGTIPRIVILQIFSGSSEILAKMQNACCNSSMINSSDE
jgi:hypothetical protein